VDGKTNVTLMWGDGSAQQQNFRYGYNHAPQKSFLQHIVQRTKARSVVMDESYASQCSPCCHAPIRHPRMPPTKKGNVRKKKINDRLSICSECGRNWNRDFGGAISIDDKSHRPAPPSPAASKNKKTLRDHSQHH